MIYNEFVDYLNSLKLKLPREVEVTPQQTATFLSALISVNKVGRLQKLFGKKVPPLSLEIVLEKQEIYFAYLL